MNRRIKVILTGMVVAVILFSAPPVIGSQFAGGYGYLHTNTALLMPPGALDMSMYMRGFVSVFNANLDQTISDGTSALTTSFGYTRHTEVAFTQILYQDLNQTRSAMEDQEAVMIPGDTYVRFKFAGYQMTPQVFWGFMPVMHYRVGKYHDIQLEPYASDGVEAELQFIASYYQKPLYPDEALSVHLNLGYTNHNDGEAISTSAQSLSFLLSFMRPRESRLDYGAEVYGSFFLTRPPETTLSREDWIYVTPMVRYNLFFGLRFTLGLDILVLGNENTTTIPEGSNLGDWPNYSNWRLSGRINFRPSTSFYASNTFTKTTEVASSGHQRRAVTSGTVEAGGQAIDRQSLFRWAVEERPEDIEAIDLDLAKIRQERRKAEEKLERLKKELEKKNQKKK